MHKKLCKGSRALLKSLFPDGFFKSGEPDISPMMSLSVVCCSFRLKGKNVFLRYEP